MIGTLIDTMANIEYGLLIAIIIDAILLVIISMQNDKAKLSALSYIVALLLLIPLTFQMSRLIGACYTSRTASTINDIVGAVSPTLGRYVSSATKHNVGWFIFRRVMWSAMFLAIGGFCIYATMESEARNPRRRGRSPRYTKRYYDNDF